MLKVWTVEIATWSSFVLRAARYAEVLSPQYQTLPGTHSVCDKDMASSGRDEMWRTLIVIKLCLFVRKASIDGSTVAEAV